MQSYPYLTPPQLLLMLCLGLGGVTAAAAMEPDRAATLEAIHDLENPRNLTRPGPGGELGAYQFREATWRAYTTAPFATALDRAMSDSVAEKHYEWLKRRLGAAHLPVTTYNIALAWNGGIRAAVTGRAPRAARDYARRAANLAGLFRHDLRVADTR